MINSKKYRNRNWIYENNLPYLCGWIVGTMYNPSDNYNWFRSTVDFKIYYRRDKKGNYYDIWI